MSLPRPVCEVLVLHAFMSCLCCTGWLQYNVFPVVCEEDSTYVCMICLATVTAFYCICIAFYFAHCTQQENQSVDLACALVSNFYIQVDYHLNSCKMFTEFYLRMRPWSWIFSEKYPISVKTSWIYELLKMFFENEQLSQHDTDRVAFCAQDQLQLRKKDRLLMYYETIYHNDFKLQLHCI